MPSKPPKTPKNDRFSPTKMAKILRKILYSERHKNLKQGGKFMIELFKLVGFLFTKRPGNQKELELLAMKNFPGKGFLAMMWCGYFIYRKENEEEILKTLKNDPAFLHHEEIHLHQAGQFKTWIGYYLSYLWEWIKGRPLSNKHSGAYYTIPYEVEAFANEDNLEYTTLGKLQGSRYDIKNRLEVFRERGNRWKQYIKTL